MGQVQWDVTQAGGILPRWSSREQWVRGRLRRETLSWLWVPGPGSFWAERWGSARGPTCLGRQCARCVAGGILAGLISDYTNGRATTCCVMLILAAPTVCRTSRAKCVCVVGR